MDYGLPYKGSKRKLVERISELMPRATHLYDLFCGGCAMAHYALTHGKYKQVHINDIDARMPELFSEALQGIDESRLFQWVSRDDFQMLAPHDGLIACCWSFGNNLRDYLYPERRERLKGLAHRLIFGQTAEQRHKGYIDLIREVQTLVADLCDEHAKHEAWRNKQKEWRESHDAPRGLLEKNRNSWEVAMMRTEVMMPLIRYFRKCFDESAVTMKQLEQHLGTQMAGHYFTNGSQWCLPTREHYARLRQIMPNLKREYDDLKLEYDELKSKYEELKPMFDYLGNGKTENDLIMARLQELDSIERVNLLKGMCNPSAAQRLSVTTGDYQSVIIEPDSVIYCDPPYIGTNVYHKDLPFDHERFYDWCERQTSPVFISEYDMPRDRFRCIAEFEHHSQLNQKGSTAVTERLFIPIHQEYAEQAQLTLF